MNIEQLKQKLLEDAAQKPIHRFVQFDVFQRIEDGGDDIVTPDQDGDCVFGGGTPHHELNITNELRVMVPEGRTAEEVIRGLQKIIEWIKSDPSCLNYDGWQEKNILDTIYGVSIEPPMSAEWEPPF